MSKKIIHYHRKGNKCTFPKEDFSDEEFESLIPLFRDQLRIHGHQTFQEFIDSHHPSAKASACLIGGKVLRRRCFEEANESGGESVSIDFIIDLEKKKIEIKSEFPAEIIGLELKILELYHYRSHIVKQD